MELFGRGDGTHTDNLALGTPPIEVLQYRLGHWQLGYL